MPSATNLLSDLRVLVASIKRPSRTVPDSRNRFLKVWSFRTLLVQGVWRARLHPGPSRIVKAVYGGSSKFEPSASKTAGVVVPADLRIHVQPRHAHWGGSIGIGGVVRGGHIPPSGEIVFLWVGWKDGQAEIGHLYTSPNGSFSSTYTFHRGTGIQSYRIWATSVRETDYPYVPGRSNRVAVTVSP